MKLSLSLSEADRPAWLNIEVAGKLERIAAAIEPAPASPVDVVLVDDEYIRRINRDYRATDRPTDVISFSYVDDASTDPPGDDVAGEVYVSYETIEREAKEQGLNTGHLFLRIGVHGLLHVLGFDHQTGADAIRMEAEERRLLCREMTTSEVDELFSPGN